MTENKRLIQGTYSTRRYLHSDEFFHKERNWNINLPSEREFKNGYCIITDKDNTAYSIDELVELLNEFQKENEELKKELVEFKKWEKYVGDVKDIDRIFKMSIYEIAEAFEYYKERIEKLERSLQE